MIENQSDYDNFTQDELTLFLAELLNQHGLELEITYYATLPKRRLISFNLSSNEVRVSLVALTKIKKFVIQIFRLRAREAFKRLRTIERLNERSIHNARGDR